MLDVNKRTSEKNADKRNVFLRVVTGNRMMLHNIIKILEGKIGITDSKYNKPLNNIWIECLKTEF
jgi:hypothetical protein